MMDRGSLGLVYNALPVCVLQYLFPGPTRMPG